MFSPSGECQLGPLCPFCHPENPLSSLPFMPGIMIIEIQRLKPLPVEQIKAALKCACQCSPVDMPLLETLKQESFVAMAFSFAVTYASPTLPAEFRIEAILRICRAQGMKMTQDPDKLAALDTELKSIFAEAK